MSTILLKLTKGYSALIDEESRQILGPWKWCATENGTKVYAVRNDNGKRVYMHTVISGFEFTDHINGDTLDNRKSNLRSANKSKNGMNRGKARGNYSSNHKGVSYCNTFNRWAAAVRSNGIAYRKTFKTEAEAIAWVIKTGSIVHGEFHNVSSSVSD